MRGHKRVLDHAVQRTSAPEMQMHRRRQRDFDRRARDVVQLLREGKEHEEVALREQGRVGRVRETALDMKFHRRMYLIR